MKKKLTCYGYSPIAKQIVRKMKLTVLLLTIAILSGYATDSYSQAARLTLNLENNSIKNVLKEIEKQSEFRFFYSGEVDVESNASVSVINKNVMETLDELFRGTGIRYDIYGRQIALLASQETALPAEVQQAGFVTGKVTDLTGAPLPGVTVVIKGTTTGTISDANGNYTLGNVPPNATLVFSFVGMRTQELAVAGKTSVDITLLEETIGIEEVVAIGYGTMKKSDLTGAVASVKMKDFEKTPNTNLIQALQGTTAGVNVSSSGRPGADGRIIIRGQQSISASNDPLIILDGIPWTGRLSDISQNDIQSIDILKDVSSTAIYGARAANGVIIITSKRGKGKLRVNFAGYAGLQDYSYKLQTQNGQQYMQTVIAYQEALGTQNINYENPEVYLLGAVQENYKNGKEINGLDYIKQNAPIQNYELSISGATDKSSYYFSVATTDQKGIIFNDNFSRIALRNNFETEIHSWLKFGMNTSYSNRDYSGVEANLDQAYWMHPYADVEDDNGNLILLIDGDGMNSNPLWNAMKQTDKEYYENLFNLMYAKIDIPAIKGLSYQINYSNTFRWNHSYFFNPIDFRQGQKVTGSGRKTESRNRDWILENLLRYDRDLGKHHLDLTLLYSANKSDYTATTASSSDYITDALIYNSLQLGQVRNVSTGASDASGISSMGRINYRYDEKYYITTTLRRDGYSAFGENRKYGYFPSVALGWIINKENFMKNLTIVDFLKLRASYGVSGNQGVSSYSTKARISSSGADYVYGTTTATGFFASTMANSDLGWETTKGLNLGVDYGFWKNRISGSFELYQAETTDLLLKRTIPVMNGFNDVWQNIGATDNKGMELTLNTENLQKGILKWSSTVNFWLNRNKIKHLYRSDLNKDGKEDDDMGNSWFIGHPITSVFDYTLNGVFQQGEQLPNDKFKVGYYRIVDINEDELIDTNDRSIIGKKDPDFSLGLLNKFQYKGLSLTFFINSRFGGIKNNGELNPATNFVVRRNSIVKNYWTPENKSTSWPVINYPNPYGHGFYGDLTFIRFQDVTLSYDFNNSWLKKLHLDGLSMYISGKNLYTITSWKGWDPEREVYTESNFPLIKSWVIGLNLSL
jgi:TonB-linked SusC/RagA family outer membrane protein